MKIWKLFERKHKNFKYLLKIKGPLKIFLNIERIMSIPSPLKQYHFHAILIWWHSPFKSPRGRPTVRSVEWMWVKITDVVYLKAPSHQISFAWNWCHQIRITDEIWRWTFYTVLEYLPACDILKQLLWTLTKSLVSLMAGSVDTSHSLFTSLPSLIYYLVLWPFEICFAPFLCAFLFTIGQRGFSG